MVTWIEHVEKWRDCQKCPLGSQRTRICIARGEIPADVCFIGEAPGTSEDIEGQPFVGPAGRLLDNYGTLKYPGIVQKAGLREMGLSLVFCNLVCCFPREAKQEGTNEPTDEEIKACESRLIEFVNIAQPRLIVTVGRLAERWIDSEQIGHLNIIHPAALLKPGLPMIVKQSRMDDAIVMLAQAGAELLQSKRGPWKKWENGGYAKVEANARRKQLFRLSPLPGDDGIPF